MSKTITIDVPDDAFSILRRTPEEFARQMRLAAAVKWYEVGIVSQSKGAALAGLSRAAFIDAMAGLGVSPLQETPEELEAEFKRG